MRVWKSKLTNRFNLLRKITKKYSSLPYQVGYLMLVLLIIFGTLYFRSGSSKAITDTFTSSGNWIVPANVYSAVFEAWGGGGGGGLGDNSLGSGIGGGGGAGGMYAKKTLSVSVGDTYTVTVGAAGAGCTTATCTTSTTNGGGSFVTSPTSVVFVKASGGMGSTDSCGGSAGSITCTRGLGNTSGGIGDLLYAGGSGGTGTQNVNSGGGGGGAGSTGIGGDATIGTAGTGTSLNGGNGATGRNTKGVGSNGSNYGGGGSGGFATSGQNQAGGNGAAGLITVTYTTLSYTQSNYQWFSNADSTTPGSVLAAMSSPATLTTTGQAFRLRQLVNPSSSILAGTNNYDEQYADLSTYGTCSAIPSSNWLNIGVGSGSPASSGSLGAGAGANQTLTGSSWATPGNITASDGSYASSVVNNGSNSDALVATNFGFSIPSNATVTGITVQVVTNTTVASIADLNAQLVKANVTQPTNRSTGGNWSNGTATRTYGSSTDTWGNSWLPSDINNSGFGFYLVAENVGISGTRTANVDYISVNVNYTIPNTSGPNLTTSVSTTANGPGSLTWGSPNNITSTNGVYATYAGNGANPSDYLKAEGFGFNIPASAVISGVTSDVVGHATLSGSANDASVMLLKSDTISGTDQSYAGTWGTGDSTRTYGGAANLWGTTLTPSDVNNPGFGIAFSDFATVGINVLIDSISVTVYYFVPAIAYKDNPTPANGASISATGNDPTDSTNSVSPQTYQEANAFTTTSTTGGTVDSEWDLSLFDNSAPASTTYCFRTVISGGTAFGTYSFYPQITTASANNNPAAPTLIAPGASASNVSTYPVFTLRTTDAEADNLRYRIYLYQSNCSTPIGTSPFDQNTSQTGWSGQDANSNTAYVGSSTLTSSTVATYELLSSGQSGLTPNTVYCWKADAVDPGGSGIFGSASATQTFTTETSARPVNIKGNINIKGNTNIR